MKKADRILLITVLVLGMAGVGICFITMRPASYVVVEIDGEIQGMYELRKDAIVPVASADGGENVLVIQNGKARIRSSNCPNQDCVEHKEISLSNEMIICLPHKVVITVIDEVPEGGPDSLAY